MKSKYNISVGIVKLHKSKQILHFDVFDNMPDSLPFLKNLADNN